MDLGKRVVEEPESVGGVSEETLAIRAKDREYLWHPFTQHERWGKGADEPLVLVRGEGAWLWDSEGRKYLDGNASIWTNLHGHGHPKISGAIGEQLGRVAHTSFLGFTHPLAAELAEQLVGLWPEKTLTRVFFSDNGSTAIEVALKIALQYFQQTGEVERTRFVSFRGAYHGDTMGASSLGGIATFRGGVGDWHLPVEQVSTMEELEKSDGGTLAAVVIEPLIQGAAGMHLWPLGMLREVREWCDRRGVLLILDEVMTGFGRTGKMFACEWEGVVPDLVALAKGLTGGYLPMAATMTSERIFSAFLGGAERTLYYGHSYTANALGCAAALANLAIFREENVLGKLGGKIEVLRGLLGELAEIPEVWEVRQCGMIVGIELREADGQRFPREALMGAKVCVAARRHGLLTRPILDVVVLVPPYCMTESELGQAVRAIGLAVREVCWGKVVGES